MIKVAKEEVRERMVDTQEGDNACPQKLSTFQRRYHYQSFNQRLSLKNSVAKDKVEVPDIFKAKARTPGALRSHYR